MLQTDFSHGSRNKINISMSTSTYTCLHYKITLNLLCLRQAYFNTNAIEIYKTPYKDFFPLILRHTEMFFKLLVDQSL